MYNPQQWLRRGTVVSDWNRIFKMYPSHFHHGQTQLVAGLAGRGAAGVVHESIQKQTTGSFSGELLKTSSQWSTFSFSLQTGSTKLHNTFIFSPAHLVLFFAFTDKKSKRYLNRSSVHMHPMKKSTGCMCTDDLESGPTSHRNQYSLGRDIKLLAARL